MKYKLNCFHYNKILNFSKLKQLPKDSSRPYCVGAELEGGNEHPTGDKTETTDKHPDLPII